MANRLAESVSPYLRSHADNPVDWWRWGEEPFAEAVRRDVPVIVSIGYATCHWCHVMARESFSDPQLAGYLNENFVAIKVDREEHPDVDATFLAAASAFTRHLGWPLTVFTTPDGNPVFGGTYFPPVAAGGLPSFRDVLEAVSDAWTNRRDDLEATGRILAEAIATRTEPREGGLPLEPELAAAAVALEVLEDPEFGGFGSESKFPTSPALAFLIERGEAGDEPAGAFVRRTLATLAGSALRDPVEGGVFRYAVRRDWTEPHFERMLSDNAQLLDLACAVDDPAVEDRAFVEGLATFLLDVLRLPSGAFASAQDSESLVDGESSEGGYYELDRAQRASQPPPELDESAHRAQRHRDRGALDRGCALRARGLDRRRATRCGCRARRTSTGGPARPGVTRRSGFGCRGDSRGLRRARRWVGPVVAGDGEPEVRRRRP
jgi:uncharacterized protein YyaL (SSP411 family)